MRTASWTAGILFLALLLFVLFRPDMPAGNARSLTEPQPAPGEANSAGGERMPVLVELFTSEGCSSCPPADALLGRLEKTQPVPGAQIIALKQHVDYWNRLGWIDRFSSEANTRRQQEYANHFGSDSVYTPQMIVDGESEFVGSAESRARNAIAAAARAAKLPLTIELLPAMAGASAAKMPRFRIRAEKLSLLGDAQAEVLLTIVEDNLHTDVPRGENAGRSLDHAAVLRAMESAGRLSAAGGDSATLETAIPLESGWRRENLRAIAFVQDRASRRVLGVAQLRLTP